MTEPSLVVTILTSIVAGVIAGAWQALIVWLKHTPSLATWSRHLPTGGNIWPCLRPIFLIFLISISFAAWNWGEMNEIFTPLVGLTFSFLLPFAITSLLAFVFFLPKPGWDMADDRMMGGSCI